MFSFLPVAVALTLAQLSEGAGALGGATRAGLAGWLLAHGVPLGTSLGPLGLPPLAVGVFAAWRVSRAGVHTCRAYGIAQRGSPLQAANVAGTVGLGYGVVGLAGRAAGRPARARGLGAAGVPAPRSSSARWPRWSARCG